MYDKHLYLTEPAPDTKLWRYMDLAKYLHLLESRTLHMASLLSFDDPFEGQPPKSVVTLLTAEPPTGAIQSRGDLVALVERNLKLFERARASIFASCWHMNSSESAGMWSQYLRTGEGIAVQTTFARMRQAVHSAPDLVHGAVVEYVDFDAHVPDHLNLLTTAALKRKSFEHEREFRLLQLLEPGAPAPLVPVDLEALIEHVYVAPTTPDWLFRLVESLNRRYDLRVQPVRSELLAGPSYLSLPQWARDA